MTTANLLLKNDTILDGITLSAGTVVTTAKTSNGTIILCHGSGWYLVDESYFKEHSNE